MTCVSIKIHAKLRPNISINSFFSTIHSYPSINTMKLFKNKFSEVSQVSNHRIYFVFDHQNKIICSECNLTIRFTKLFYKIGIKFSKPLANKYTTYQSTTPATQLPYSNKHRKPAFLDLIK